MFVSFQKEKNLKFQKDRISYLFFSIKDVIGAQRICDFSCLNKFINSIHQALIELRPVNESGAEDRITSLTWHISHSNNGEKYLTKKPRGLNTKIKVCSSYKLDPIKEEYSKKE